MTGSPWSGWVLSTVSVGVGYLVAGGRAEDVLRAGLATAVLLAATRRWPRRWAFFALAALVAAVALLDRPFGVQLVGSMALWVAMSGALNWPQDPASLRPVGWALLSSAIAAMLPGAISIALVLLAACWLGAAWLGGSSDVPRWVSAAGEAWQRSVPALTPAGSRPNRPPPAGESAAGASPPRKAGASAPSILTEGPDEPVEGVSKGMLTPVLAWLGVTVLAGYVQNLAIRIAEEGVTWASVLPGLSPTAGKGGWDTLYYINIARFGYALPPDQDFTFRPESDLVAYFPGYPALIRALAWLPGVDESLASILIALTAGLAATVLFWHWLSLMGLGKDTRRTALALFLLYPYSFMLTGVAYAEPMALALVLGAFVAAEHRHHVTAGLLAAAATFTRPTALAIVVALPLLVAERDKLIGWSRARPPRPRINPSRARGVLVADWGVLLAMLGVATYAGWLLATRGDPIAFWTVQENYGQGSALSLETWMKVDFIRSVPQMTLEAETLNQLAALAATVVAAVSIPTIGRRFGLGYAVFVLGLVASVLLGAKLFSPGGRYLVMAFPAVAVVADFLAGRRLLRATVLSLAAVGWVLLTWRFARTESLAW